MIQFLSLFSGIGAPEKALDRLGVEYNLVNYCEIDKYASKSYSAIHNVPESKNLGDITKVDTSKLPHIDMICYGFPCQDISLAGLQKGLFNEDGSKTRSGLFFEALRIIEDTKPAVAIAENVKNLTSKKFAEQFEIVLNSLDNAGYNNYWQVLNAKDYGVPQNRERVFIVSIRKDLDPGNFKFPKPFELMLRLKDLLENEVDEKYYLSDKIQERFKVTDDTFSKNVVGTTIGDECTRIGERDLVYQTNSIMGTLNATDYKQPKQIIDVEAIRVKEATKQGYAEAYEGDSINLEQPNSKTRRGRVGKQVAQTLTTSPQQGVVEPAWNKNKNVTLDTYIDMALESGCELPCAVDEQNVTINTKGTVGTITTNGSSAKRNNRVLVPVNPMPDGTCRTIKNQYYKTSQANYERTGSMGATGVNTGLRIRKLTPLECYRLMGFDDEDFYKAEKVNSNTQLYKQAGNSIVVDVLEYLFKEILEAVDMKKVDNKVTVFEGDDLINLVALKEKEPELYEELLADYPCESGTYIFNHKVQKTV